jgi:ABC-2 type transport system ATP-binding protein
MISPDAVDQRGKGKVHAIQTDKLTRYFGNRAAICDVSLYVEPGEVFGVLGPNGAGKTTMVRLLNGVLAPSAGSCRVLGFDPAKDGGEVRRRTGVLTESPALYERMTARENLTFFGTLYGMSDQQLVVRCSEMLEAFGLAERADDRVGSFSKGMKQRLALARALLHNPEALFLDEPTAALDPEAARRVTELIVEFSRSAGRTVFICTHYLPEAERLCDRVAVLNRGHLIAIGTLADLSRTLWHGTWADIECLTPPDATAIASLRALPYVTEVQVDGGRLAVQLESKERVPEAVKALVQQGGSVLRVNPREHTLEEVYFELQSEVAEVVPVDGVRGGRR